MYLRLVTPTKLHDQAARSGIFAAAYGILKQPEIPAEIAESIQGQIDWFELNLPVPDRFSKSRSKGAWRRRPKGISWFRDDGGEAVQQARHLAELLRYCGCEVEEIRCDRIGYIVYEDENQVTAVPFNDTPT